MSRSTRDTGTGLRSVWAANRRAAGRFAPTLHFWFLGAAAAFLLQTPLHEIGHFSFGYLFGPEHLVGIDIDPVRNLARFFTLGEDQFVAGETRFEGDIFRLYGPTRATVIVLGGFLFDAAFLALLYSYMRRLRRRPSGENGLKRYALLLGAYFPGMLQVSVSWRRDMSVLLLYFLDEGVAQLLFVAVYVSVIVLYAFGLVLSVGPFYREENRLTSSF